MHVGGGGRGRRQPATPEQQYQALLKEYNDAFQEYAKAYGEAKTPQDQQKVVQDKYPWPDKYASKFLALAEKNPKEPFAEEALIWIMTNEYQLLRFRPWYEHHRSLRDDLDPDQGRPPVWSPHQGGAGHPQ